MPGSAAAVVVKAAADPDTFVVMIIDPAQAQRELANMRYVQAEEGPG
ncbi:MAG TPA: hypothetical protein VGU20_19830 [Stellaceae bacterium]|nr:hypothetical protein [Stellaceae bacterium]